jgi:rfaE bifunctional protein kinase chain/domain/rfaE bifunctional protein nucleotidyltransferase chain/domain
MGRFSTIDVAVVGDLIYDAYLDGRATRVSREGPAPVVEVEERQEAAGGAANVAVNLAALGARVELYSVIGDDDAGARIVEIAREHGVGIDGVVVSETRRTCAKQRVLADGHMLVRFDEGTEAPPEPGEEARVHAAVGRGVRTANAVVVSDYGAGVVTDGLIDRVVRGMGDVPLVVDGHDPCRFRHARPAVSAPSFTEVAPLLAISPEAAGGRAEAVAASGERILMHTGAEIAVVTLDRDGAVVLERGRRPRCVVTDAIRELCATGAGDTFTAALTLSLVAGTDAVSAASIAAAAAGVVVGKPGTSTCSLAELRRRLIPNGKLIPDAEQLACEADRHRLEGRRIALANGCFDILHCGHIAMLEEARRLGDVLVVAVNGDESVRRLKGPGRPVNTLAERIEVLGALACVDHIVPFDTDQPLELIRALRPDVLVKGGDYTEETVPEAALVRSLGGRVQIVDLVPERSTSRIIERARVPVGA